MGYMRKGRPGFTLTEILMAVGILGVGLTMVATIFPVAVNQNRRSNEMTQTALFARSTYAMIRARRHKILSAIRTYEETAGKTTPVEHFRLDDKDCMPSELQVFNPYMFTYDWNRLYPPGTDRWAAGNYTAVIYANPLRPGGPYRVAFVVYAARRGAPNVVPLAQLAPTPGDYVYDRTDFRGEAHMVDYATGTTVHTAAVPLNTPPIASPNWLVVPDAVMAYHVVLGD